jgi:hypothetical protein
MLRPSPCRRPDAPRKERAAGRPGPPEIRQPLNFAPNARRCRPRGPGMISRYDRFAVIFFVVTRFGVAKLFFCFVVVVVGRRRGGSSFDADAAMMTHRTSRLGVRSSGTHYRPGTLEGPPAVAPIASRRRRRRRRRKVRVHRAVRTLGSCRRPPRRRGRYTTGSRTLCERCLCSSSDGGISDAPVLGDEVLPDRADRVAPIQDELDGSGADVIANIIIVGSALAAEEHRTRA